MSDWKRALVRVAGVIGALVCCLGAVGQSAPYVGVQPAVWVSANSATLNGMVVPNGQSTLAWFEWGTNKAYGQQTVPVALGAGANVVRVTNGIDGLRLGVTYHFRLVATNSTGAAYGADQMFAVGKKVIVWGANSSGQANVPAAASQSVFGRVNNDLLITLFGTDANGDLLQLRIATLPGIGALYQCNSNGSRGIAITAPNTVVTDPANRVVFVPATNGYGNPYASFTVVASDGQLESAPGVVTIGILPTTPPSITSCGINNGTFQLTLWGETNTSYTMWASTNLVNWQMLGPMSGLATQSQTGWFCYEDATGTNYPQRFYRAATE